MPPPAEEASDDDERHQSEAKVLSSAGCVLVLIPVLVCIITIMDRAGRAGSDVNRIHNDLLTSCRFPREVVVVCAVISTRAVERLAVLQKSSAIVP